MLTIKDVAARTGLSPHTIRNYTSGRSEPPLPATYAPGPGGVRCEIAEADFEAWWACYQDKEPFGSNLHVDRMMKKGA